MQDKGHKTVNSPTFKITSPGNHAYNSHRNIKSNNFNILSTRNMVAFTQFSHTHLRFSSLLILLGCVILENCPLLRRNFWHRVKYLWKWTGLVGATDESEEKSTLWIQHSARELSQTNSVQNCSSSWNFPSHSKADWQNLPGIHCACYFSNKRIIDFVRQSPYFSSAQVLYVQPLAHV